MARFNKRLCCKILVAVILCVTLILHVIGDGHLTEEQVYEQEVLHERLDTTEWRKATDEERIKGRSTATRRIAKQKQLLFHRVNNSNSDRVQMCTDNQCG